MIKLIDFLYIHIRQFDTPQNNTKVVSWRKLEANFNKLWKFHSINSFSYSESKIRKCWYYDQNDGNNIAFQIYLSDRYEI